MIRQQRSKPSCVDRGVESILHKHFSNGASPLVFDETDRQRGGLEILGAMTLNTVTGGNALNHMAQNGLIIHEFIAYPKFLSDAEHDDVVQWFGGQIRSVMNMPVPTITESDILTGLTCRSRCNRC